VSEVAIIESAGANLASLVFALERLGARAHVTGDVAAVTSAPRVILPGVGAAGDAMQRLHKGGFGQVLPRLEQPVLGICLGMQLLFTRLEEGDANGLSILDDTVHRLEAAPGRPVPHMGWNRLKRLRDDPLLEGIAADDYVYFVHSYAAPVSSSTLAATLYGAEFASVVRRRNFWGAQFHPERSAEAGARVLRNFLELQ
jgi:glutamine amidotransferase